MNQTIEHSTYHLQDLLVRMERNHNVVQRLSKKLNSYTYEPKNHSCFEKLYDLKLNFKMFMGHQNRIMEQLRLKKGESKTLVEEIKLHIERFKELEKEIAAYLLNIGNCS
ncbi:MULTISPECIES: hypothetical protein [Flavobacteriaceae]|uniref:hypothetical protein n=1 Tax=Flavobacteriaceae TaxID=49546 RepID=UPI00149252F4|nr:MULTISPECIES: hypothetical protein [Allomuricauda]MDC6364727.1 hypothetical protein [Muricauda sp. AC10]